MALRRLALWSIIAGGVAAAMPWSGAGAAEPRAVIELFTSQGCSSCPPADRLLGELANDSSIIALSLPVDYWDYLGWKDTLASPRYSAKQRAYSHVRGDRDVFTPQVVVNGTIHVLGSDRAAIERAIAQSKRAAMLVPVSVIRTGDLATVNVPEGKGQAEVWVCGVARSVPVAIGRGENRGSTITYHNVGKRWVKLGSWSGGAASWTIPLSEIKADGVDAIAIVMQSGSPENPGPMLGAAFAALD